MMDTNLFKEPGIMDGMQMSDPDYYRFDDLVSKELNDLDIQLPLEVNTNSSNLSATIQPSLLNLGGKQENISVDNNSPFNNKGLLNLPDFNWSQLQLDNNNGMDFENLSMYKNNGMPKSNHRREPSGTAIFGFANHDKNLSISSTNGFLKDPTSILQNSNGFGSNSFLNDPNMNFQLNNSSTRSTSNNIFNNNNLSKDNSYKSSNSNYSFLQDENINSQNPMGYSLTKQQESLKLALEKQIELNKKLEQQLIQNQMEQQKLENVLYKSSSYDQPNMETPNRPTNISPSRTIPSNNADNAVIVTTDRKTGKYQFPPPTMASPSSSTSRSNSINGSPIRRRNHTNRSSTSTELPSAQPSIKIENANTPNIFSTNWNRSAMLTPNGSTASSIANQDRLNITLDQLGDPFSLDNKLEPSLSRPTGAIRHSLSPQHQQRPSNMSTVSTIAQNHDDYSTPDHFIAEEDMNLNTSYATESNEINNTHRNMTAFETLPTIPGSSENTPMKDMQGKLPQKYTFQHTPVKNNTQKQLEQTPKSNTRKQFLSPADIYRPPQLNFNQSPNSNKLTNSSEFSSPSRDSTNSGSESPYKMSGEYTQNLEASPIKITRKLTTLPRGSIDKYVKELPNKLFECLYPKCHKIFKRRYNVRSHIQTHLEDRPYICDYDGCNKAFVRNHDLVRHKKSHVDKMFSCKCGKSFNKEDGLVSHKCKTASEKPKSFDNFVGKRSPKKQPNASLVSVASPRTSPKKVPKDKNTEGYILQKMEEQLKNDLAQHGLLQPPSRIDDTANMLSFSPPINYLDLDPTFSDSNMFKQYNDLT